MFCRFQEVVPLSVGNVLGSTNIALVERWMHLIQQTLNGNVMNLKQTNSMRSYIKSKSSPQSPFCDSVDARMNMSGSHQDNEFSMCNPGYYSASVRPSELKRPNDRYALLASKQMVGVFMSIWIRVELQRHVHDLKVSCVGCGLMGYLGNKVSQLIYGTYLGIIINTY